MGREASGSGGTRPSGLAASDTSLYQALQRGLIPHRGASQITSLQGTFLPSFHLLVSLLNICVIAARFYCLDSDQGRLLAPHTAFPNPPQEHRRCRSPQQVSGRGSPRPQARGVAAQHRHHVTRVLGTTSLTEPAATVQQTPSHKWAK